MSSENLTEAEAIEFICRTGSYPICSMEDLISATFDMLLKKNKENTFIDWVIKESADPSENYTDFSKCFIYEAFRMLEKNDFVKV